MNASETQFDRLVDGELSQNEHRELLSSLDRRPDGWKQCALAFLEAQALRQELGELLQETAKPTPRIERPAALVEPARSETGPTRQAWSQGLALAAALVLCFFLGRGSMTGDNYGNQAGMVAQNRAAVPQPAPDVQPAEQALGEELPESLQLVVNGADGQRREVELPIQPRHAHGEALISPVDAIPEEVIQAIEASGHEVRRYHEWIPVPYDGNHKAMLRVDHIRVVPKKRPTF